MIQERFDTILKGLIPYGETVLLAISGGIDSICMGELFANSKLKIHFAVAHCNFHLRDSDSDADEALVKTWTEKHNAEFHKIDFNTSEYAEEHSLSIEMAARELRYNWFSELCKVNGYCGVAVAHNANDNAETLILNLLRGTGLKGMLGMSSISSIPVKDSEIRLFRPVLEFSREEIRSFIAQNGVDYRDDKTNFENIYKRNKIRNQVFPLFEEINPSFLKTFNRNMKLFAQRYEISEEYFQTCCKSLILKPSGHEILKVYIANITHIKHHDFILYKLLYQYGFSGIIASLISLLNSDRTTSGKRFESENGYTLFLSKNYLSVYPSKTLENSVQPAYLSINGEGIYEFGDTKFLVEILDLTSEIPFKQPNGIIMFDAEKLNFPFFVRHWQQGDWITPLGLKGKSSALGKKKISDLFTDLKFNWIAKRNAAFIVKQYHDNEIGSHVYAMLGMRIDDSIKLTNSSSKAIRITIL